MKTFLSLSVFCMCMMQTPAFAAWSFAWLVEPDSGSPTCSAATERRMVKTGDGKAETSVRLAIQAEGFIAIESDALPFETRSLRDISLSIDGAAPINGPRPGSDNRILTFSEEDSIRLHRQFENGTVITMIMLFAKDGKAVTQQFTLERYREVSAQYKACRGLLLSSGWVGMYMTNASSQYEWMAWVKKNSPYEKPGILVVNVDPRKEASKSDIRPGDYIIGFDGEDAEVELLIRAMKGLGAGKAIELDVVRSRERMRKVLTRPLGEEKRD